MDSAKRVMSGTWGEVWLDNEYVAEAYKIQAKSSFNKEDIAMCGRMATDKKVTSITNTGSIGMHKINSRMAIAIGEAIRNGKDIRFTIISKLADPDALGTERVLLTNVSFDDLTLADWEAKSVGKIEAPFTFGDFEYLDRVEANG